MRWTIFCTCLLLAAGGVSGAELDRLLKDEKIFSRSIRDFAGTYAKPLRFRPQSRSGKSWRHRGDNSTILGLPVIEGLVGFRDQRLHRLAFSIYNRGDVDMLDRPAFEALVEKAVKAVSAFTGKSPRRRRDSGASKKDSYLWIVGDRLFRLDCNDGKTRVQGEVVYRSEYIRLRLEEYDKKTGLSKIDSEEERQRPKEYVVEKDNGDVYVDRVPMINQGKKGYCACATAARVLQHYGHKLDMHELAQIAKTANKGGTSAAELMKGIRAAKSKLHVRVKTLDAMFDGSTISFKQVISDYNRTAKKHRKSEIELPRGGRIDVGKIFKDMDKAVYVESRLRRRSKVRRFERDVKDYTKDGVPLFWTIVLGFVKEPEIPQAFGGHMRLIIGFNDKTEEIIYSDSWGPGHEFKKMKLTDAYAITTGLYAITPK